jgi:hypothetical protein
LVGVALAVFGHNIAEGLQLPIDACSLFDEFLFPEDEETLSSLQDEYGSFTEAFENHTAKHYHLCCLLYLKRVAGENGDRSTEHYKTENNDVICDTDNTVSVLLVFPKTLTCMI